MTCTSAFTADVERSFGTAISPMKITDMKVTALFRNAIARIVARGLRI